MSRNYKPTPALDKVYQAALLVDPDPVVFYGSLGRIRGWWMETSHPMDDWTHYVGKNWKKAVAYLEKEQKERRFTWMNEGKR